MDTNKIFIDMAQRAREFAEMCCLMQKIPDMPLTVEVKDALDEYAKRLGLPKQDPEAWREVPQEVSASECQKALEHLAKTYSADKGTAQLNPPLPHAAERSLWKAQRAAGTNEVWQCCVIAGRWLDIEKEGEPRWSSDVKYRVKPMKLTAKICRVGKAYPMSYSGQDWQFTGTREEYRAECEKYGYAILSEIKEVVEKPKTVKYYSVNIHMQHFDDAGRYLKGR